MKEHADNRRIAAALLALALLFGNTSCSLPCKERDPNSTNYSYPRKGDMPTEEELEVARTMGYTDGRITKISEEGFDFWSARYVGIGLKVKRHLEEKYKMDFEILDVISEFSLADPWWTCKVRVSSGEYERTRFEAQLVEGQEEKFEDNLVPTVRGDEVLSIAYDAIKEAYVPLGFHGAFDGSVAPYTYGDELTLEASMSELVEVLRVDISNYVSPWTELSYETYKEAVNRLEESLAKKGFKHCLWEVYHILSATAPDDPSRTVTEKTFTHSFAQRVIREGQEGIDWEWYLHGFVEEKGREDAAN